MYKPLDSIMYMICVTYYLLFILQCSIFCIISILFYDHAGHFIEILWYLSEHKFLLGTTSRTLVIYGKIPYSPLNMAIPKEVST